MSLANILTELASAEDAIDGIEEAYSEVPESLNVFPCVINIPSGGEFDISYGGNTRHTINATLLVARADVPSAQNQILPFIEKFITKMKEDITLNGSCESCSLTGYEDYGVHTFAGQEYFGVVFLLDILC